jgi:hypothetical protein
MDCEQLKLSLYFDGEIGDLEITEHVERCAACADTLKSWRTIDSHLSAADVPRFQKRPPALPLLASAAALALTLTTGFALRPRHEAPVYQVQVTGARLLDCEVRLDGARVQINTKEQSQ